MYLGPYLKYPLFYSDFNQTLVKRFSKNSQISNFMEIRPVGAQLLQADGQTDRQTDMTKLVVTFLYFANGPKKPKHWKTLAEQDNMMHHGNKKRSFNTIRNEKFTLQFTVT